MEHRSAHTACRVFKGAWGCFPNECIQANGAWMHCSRTIVDSSGWASLAYATSFSFWLGTGQTSWSHAL